ncbi:serine/threonine-protein kinase [Actinomadura vinacea]|uniref:serine/threonine-protein kinase n=1 Tax=Actinomadura vinacea TaxID=115336 RepID=UPI0031CFD3A6
MRDESAPAAERARTERLVAHRYRLLAELGRGGMGVVWRARDEVLDREVAVKEMLMPAGLAEVERSAMARRAVREARSAARLSHPGVVKVFDVVVEEARPWVVMELVRGRSLHQEIRLGGPLRPDRAARIGRQLLGALGAAHAVGILHRDVKPGNVLLDEATGRAVLTDFGIAVIEGEATLTQDGGVLGSPAYIAPERMRGGRALPESDLWALGATLYAAVEGRTPFHRDDPVAVFGAVLTAEPDPPGRAGPLRPVLDGLLQKDPARRMPAGVAEALLLVAGGDDPDPSWPVPGRPAGPAAAAYPVPPPPAPSAAPAPPAPAPVVVAPPRPEPDTGPDTGPRTGPPGAVSGRGPLLSAWRVGGVLFYVGMALVVAGALVAMVMFG